MIDVETGHVAEFEDDEPVRLMTEIARRLGFELVSHRIEIFGRRLPEAKPEKIISPKKDKSES